MLDKINQILCRPTVTGLLVLLLSLTVIQAGLARPASLVGKWRMNVKESELLPDEMPPKDLVMEVLTDEPTKFRWVATVTMPDGASGSTRFDGAIDGKSYPVEGRPGSTSAFSWTEEGALKQVSESPAGIAVEICNFTGGAGITGRKMTCQSHQTDSKGRSAATIEVFNRE